MSRLSTKQVVGSTSGSVLFLDNTYGISENDNKFHWDNTNYRLGINTNTPTESLEVVGNELLKGTLNFDVANYTDAITFSSSGVSVQFDVSDNATWITTDSGAGAEGQAYIGDSKTYMAIKDTWLVLTSNMSVGTPTVTAEEGFWMIGAGAGNPMVMFSGDNSVNPLISPNAPFLQPIGLSSNDLNINATIKNSVAIGGNGLTIDKDNSAFAQELRFNSTTHKNIISDVNTGFRIELDTYGGEETVISWDGNGATSDFSRGWIYEDVNGITMGNEDIPTQNSWETYGSNGFAGRGIRASVNGANVFHSFENDITTTNSDNPNTGISTRNTALNSSTYSNSVVLGGVGLTIDKDNYAFVENLEIQSGIGLYTIDPTINGSWGDRAIPDKAYVDNVASGITSSITETQVAFAGSNGLIGEAEFIYDTFTNTLTVPNLVVSGTNTTINTDTLTTTDPIISIGGGTDGNPPTVDDNKDRGIEFQYYNGSAKKGFFGFDDSLSRFTFIPDGTNTNEVFSGSKGDVDISTLYGHNIIFDSSIETNNITDTNSDYILKFDKPNSTLRLANNSNATTSKNVRGFETFDGAQGGTWIFGNDDSNSNLWYCWAGGGLDIYSPDSNARGGIDIGYDNHNGFAQIDNSTYVAHGNFTGTGAYPVFISQDNGSAGIGILNSALIAADGLYADQSNTLFTRELRFNSTINEQILTSIGSNSSLYLGNDDSYPYVMLELDNTNIHTYHYGDEREGSFYWKNKNDVYDGYAGITFNNYLTGEGIGRNWELFLNDTNDSNAANRVRQMGGIVGKTTNSNINTGYSTSGVVYIATNDLTINGGINNSVIVGGTGIAATSGNTLFTQNFETKALTLKVDDDNNEVSVYNGEKIRKKTPQALADGATITWDMDSGANANVTLAGNRTLAITNVEAGDYGTIAITQDGTGSRTITFGNVNGGAGTHLTVSGGGGDITLTSTASAVDILSYYYDGTSVHWKSDLNYT